MNQKPSKPDKAWKLLSKRGAWIQGESARNKHGVSCDARNEHAVCFCVIGALNHVYGSAQNRLFNRAADRIFRQVEMLGFENIADWNDAEGRKKSEVVALLKEVDA